METDVVTLVDANVLLDVFTDDPDWGEWGARSLEVAIDDGLAVVNPIVYAEVSVGFSRIEDLDAALADVRVARQPLPYPAGFAAGKAFVMYRRRGGTKRSPLPDFYIGAHAAVAGYRLLTRDAQRYRTYFPTIELIAPEES